MFHSGNMVHDYSRASHPSPHTSGVCLLQYEKLALNWLLSERGKGRRRRGKEGRREKLSALESSCTGRDAIRIHTWEGMRLDFNSILS